jgi:hypothetical protein
VPNQEVDNFYFDEIDHTTVTVSGSGKKRSALDLYKEKKRASKTPANHGSYHNCDFILGSVAEVERLWSLARHVLTDTRVSTQVVNVEALLYLKINAALWDISDVVSAMRQVNGED